MSGDRKAETPGLFGFLATRLSSHPENVAIETLGYLLATSTAASRAFEDYVSRVVSISTGLHYVTQSTSDDGAIPDLVGIAPDGTSPLILEAKFWAGLTENQPVTYLDRLPAGRSGIVIFVVPSVRIELLWTEVLDRAHVYASPPMEALHMSGDLRHAQVSDTRMLAMTSWRALLATLRAAAVAGDDHPAISNIDQLSGLCERMDSQAFMPLTAEDLTGSVGLRLRQYTDLINRAVESLAARGTASTKASQGTGLYNSAAAEWWGRYFAVDDVICLLRFAAGPWARDRATPIWLQIGYKGEPSVAVILEALAPLRGERNRVFPRGQFVDVAIDLPTRVELDAVVNRMTEQIEAVAVCLRGRRDSRN